VGVPPVLIGQYLASGSLGDRVVSECVYQFSGNVCLASSQKWLKGKPSL
jgi:hypothetical protein